MKKIIFIFIILFSNTLFATPINITVALDWYINPDHATLLVAQQQGYFKQQGLNVHFITPTQNSEPEQLVAMRQAQVAVTYQTHLILDVSAGMPLMRIATLINHPLNCIAVLASSDITHLSQLKGKIFGYSDSGMQQATMRAVLAHNGVNLHDVTLVNVKMNLVQALLSHRVDAVSGMMRNVEPVEMAQMGIKTRLFFPEQNGVPDYDELVLVINKSEINQPWLKPFVEALQQAVNYIHANPEQSWQLIAKAYPNELAPTSKMMQMNHAIWNATLPYLDLSPGVLDVLRYQQFEQFMRQQNLLKASLPVSDYAVMLRS